MIEQDLLTDFPDPTEDFKRFSGLHSWYKIFLDKPRAFIPVPVIGLQPPPFFSNINDGKIHWHFYETIRDFSRDHFHPKAIHTFMKDYQVVMGPFLMALSADFDGDQVHEGFGIILEQCPTASMWLKEHYPSQYENIRKKGLGNINEYDEDVISIYKQEQAKYLKEIKIMSRRMWLKLKEHNINVKDIVYCSCKNRNANVPEQ
jgi:hypothetical protein